jgi:hypothetical protein
MRQHLQAVLGVTPTAYRRTFQTSGASRVEDLGARQPLKGRGAVYISGSAAGRDQPPPPRGRMYPPPKTVPTHPQTNEPESEPRTLNPEPPRTSAPPAPPSPPPHPAPPCRSPPPGRSG